MNSIELDNPTIVVASRLWKNSTVHFSCMYRRIKNETRRGNHHVMFTFFIFLSSRRNITIQSWFVGTVEFYFEHKEVDGTPHFLAFVEVMKEHGTAAHNSSVPIVIRRSHSSTGQTTQPKYAVNVDDIQHQVGLIQYPPSSNQFFIIAPYYVFNDNLRVTMGNLATS
ncbi:hypothetical protein CLU79DRAFT_779261 [Phycomyces nitens]|nr:hypothetical protein CLU79DRAFT_779261 [Phycomyces nitens]